jgi:hypothetical protein
MPSGASEAHVRRWQLEYLRRTKAAEYLQRKYGAYTADTLAKLAVVGGGPRFRKFGRYPLYDPLELDQWAQARMSRAVNTTSELLTS